MNKPEKEASLLARITVVKQRLTATAKPGEEDFVMAAILAIDAAYLLVNSLERIADVLTTRLSEKQ